MEQELREADNADEHTLKKGRHRKKQLYNSILQQMEFYFSDSNLTKDRFLAQLLKESPLVDLSVFLKFNKIRKLTSTVEDLQKAINHSHLIELSEDKTSVRRKAPLKEKPNVEECTIYVERLKSDATHEWLSSVFSEFGNVVYISIPRFKNNAIKGFGFVEFDKEEEAERALSFFESIGCKMPSNTEPHQLCSVATFESEGKKRKLSEEENGDGKRMKLETGEDASECDDTESKKKKKLKKEHKKERLIKELGLQVLSKREWKRMRNRYLNLQRTKMKEFKQHLFKAKYGQVCFDDKGKSGPRLDFVKGVIVKVRLPEPVSDVKKLKVELKALTNDIEYVDIPSIGADDVFLRFNNGDNAKKFLDHEYPGKKCLLEGDEEKSYWDKIQTKREVKVNKTLRKKEEVVPKLDLVQGVIVKVKLPEPVSDLKKLKTELKALTSDIQYVDIPNIGAEDVHLRFNNSESAKKFLDHEYAGKKCLLEGDEEKSYWDKIQTKRVEKFSRTKKKQRGRDKLLKKAKHIKFEDN